MRIDDYQQTKHRWYDLKKQKDYIHVPIFLWILVGFAFIIIMCLHTYNDILITAKQGYNFWNLLFEGHPLDFYKKAKMVSGNEYYNVSQGAAYLFPVYFLFAIWNFPTWLISKITGVECFNSIPSMIWMKMMLLVFVFLASKFIFLIINTSREKKQYAVLGSFLFVSSLLVMYPTALIGQYDIITVSLVLIGIYGWCQKNNKMFIVFFAVALLFKYFAFLYFFPLLLLDEKRIKKIAIKLFFVFLPIIPFLLFPKPKGQKSNVDSLLVLFLDDIKIGENKIYVFPIIFVAILVICYFKNIDADNRFQYACFYLFIIMGAFCVVISPYPYWNVLAVPSLILVAVFSANMNKSFILEMILCIGITIKNYIIYYWCFGMRTVAGMGILNKILGKNISNDMLNKSIMYYDNFSDSSLQAWLFTFLLLVFLVMVFFSRPNAKKEIRFEPFNMGTVYVRTILNLLVALAPVSYLTYILLKG